MDEKPIKRRPTSIEPTSSSDSQPEVTDARDDVTTNGPVFNEKESLEAKETNPEPTPDSNDSPVENHAEHEARIKKAFEARLKQAVENEAAKVAATNQSPTPPKEEPIPTIQDPTTTNKENTNVRKKNDCSDYLYTINGSVGDMNDAYTVSVETDPRSEEEKETNPDPYQLSLATYLRYGMGTSQANLTNTFVRSLEHEAKENKQSMPIVPCVNALKLAKVNPSIGNTTGNGGAPQVLRGSVAKTAIIARMKGVFRVSLYNSGFYLFLRPMNLAELNTFIRSVDTSFEEIGRVLGGHSHLVTDVHIKQAVCEILPGLITHSNFKYDDDPTVLMDNISFHDYDVILWALCTMIYSEGITFNLTCVNPECRHIDEAQKMSLKDMCFHNLKAFPKEAIVWMEQNFRETRTVEDLQRYRTEILKHSRTINLENSPDTYTLQVPTMGEYLKYGANMVGNLIHLAKGEKNIATDQLRSWFTLQLYRMYAPWVKYINVYDEQGKMMYKVEDTDAIAEGLETSLFEGTDFNTKLIEYIRDTKATFIGYTSLECPKCHKRPSITDDNLVSIDVQHFFFCLSSRQLEQVGI